MTTHSVGTLNRTDGSSREGRPRILIVEDDRAIQSLLEDELSAEHFAVDTVGDGHEAMIAALRRPYDLIILDLQLPSMPGLEVMRALRENRRTMPIIILSARAQESDLVQGLELGADDYVTKPFSPRELTARIRALLRRRELDRELPQTLEWGGISIDLMRQQVVVDGADVHLTPAELRILTLLADRGGSVVTRQEIVHDLWGSESYDPRAAYVHISNLRKKIEVDPSHPRHVLTVPGLGYRLGGS